jgi:hypothetical protein
VIRTSCALATSLTRAVPSQPTTSHLFRAAERLRCMPELVQNRLRTLRDQPERCTELARNAYWHHNGFAKIKMAETRNFCVRLHIWPAGPGRLGEVDPHTHRWEFASWVAVGEGIIEERFAVASGFDSGGTPYRRHDYGRQNDEELLSPREMVLLRKKLELKRTPGHVYGCARSVIHTVAPMGTGLVATVALQGPIVAEFADVYRLPGPVTEDLRSPISGEELADLFACVGDAIEGRRLAQSK